MTADTAQTPADSIKARTQATGLQVDSRAGEGGACPPTAPFHPTTPPDPWAIYHAARAATDAALARVVAAR